ncbi:MAG: hypothetical protein CSA97_00255 [Bacteroidetes bacterium]|nr:MAG: hypothetical protein CSA97_00255 [Bacteroidota bacterium]
MNGTVEIKSVGPIEYVKIGINRVNLFIGPQSSGKSTISKIFSQCLYAEKHYILTGEEKDMYRGLLDFHNFDEGYFSKDSYIHYSSKWLSITLSFEEGESPCFVSIYETKESDERYNNCKVQYLPAERNLLATIPNLERLGYTRENLRTLVDDWFEHKDRYKSTRFSVKLADLAFDYRYDEVGIFKDKERDTIRVNGVSIDLQNASSGQQSVLPLLLIAEGVCDSVLGTKRMLSVQEKRHIERKISKAKEILLSMLDSIHQWAEDEQTEEYNYYHLEEIWKDIGYSPIYNHTHLIIEEPEQNLYPSTQRSLTSRLIELLHRDKRPHTLTLTTHSLYILYALNNCMLAGLAKEKGNEAGIPALLSSSAIHPSEVSLWAVGDGKVQSLQNPEDGLIQQNGLNEQLRETMDYVYELLPLAIEPKM